MPDPVALPSAHGAAVLHATIRSVPEDFRVEELDAFPPSGQGEHLLLTIEKRGLTTAEAARRIARWAGVPESAIGHAGLKGTQHYLRLTAELYPDIVEAMDEQFGHLLPGGDQ